MSFAEHLAGLDTAQLTRLLERRPDVLVEPTPRSVRELALRLDSVDSVHAALSRVDADEALVVQAVALGGGTVADLAARVGGSPEQVGEIVDRLSARGLAWRCRDRVELPRRLAEQFDAGLSRFRPVTLIGRQARVDELRTAVGGLGGDPAGLKKPELIDRLAALHTDAEAVVRAVTALPRAAREYLDLLRTTGFAGFGYGGRSAPPVDALVQAGLLVDSAYLPELSRELAATLLQQNRGSLRGRPDLPASTDLADDGRAGAEAALLALTTLLDEARHRPLAALKKGGIGTRERTRLATKVGIPEPALWIDIAAAGSLLTRAATGYAPTSEYDAWRAEKTAARRWAGAALAWFALEPAPTSRETDDGEVPPPEPLSSAGGLVRRALLRAAAGGRSIRAAAVEIDWFCPLHPYDEEGVARKLAAAMHEAELLGVVTGDRLSALGEHLVAVADRPEPVDALAAAVADLLPDARTLLVLQSDLTAMVSGQASAAAARLLAEAAVPESRGVAATWRFTPESVRSALDLGWTADALREELIAISGRPLPQPLDYLISDVARRHGAVRVRGGRACVTGSETEIAEILATRSLRTLHLSRLAPTVLTSPFDLDDVVDRLRKAGFMPMAEDADGVAILPERADGTHRATVPPPRTRRRVGPAELAARLLAAPMGAEPVSPSFGRLAELAPQLDEAELALLADALDNGNDVQIVYRNRAGNRSARVVRPEELYGRWMASWCHLRSGAREFTVSGIESVSVPLA
jgi:hypothetical protein